jgi:hypothetical protein
MGNKKKKSWEEQSRQAGGKFGKKEKDPCQIDPNSEACKLSKTKVDVPLLNVGKGNKKNDGSLQAQKRIVETTVRTTTTYED